MSDSYLVTAARWTREVRQSPDAPGSSLVGSGSAEPTLVWRGHWRGGVAGSEPAAEDVCAGCGSARWSRNAHACGIQPRASGIRSQSSVNAGSPGLAVLTYS